MVRAERAAAAVTGIRKRLLLAATAAATHGGQRLRQYKTVGGAYVACYPNRLMQQAEVLILFKKLFPPMSDIRSLFDRWTAIITVVIFSLSVYPSYVQQASWPVEAYGYNLFLIFAYVLAAQWIYRMLIRPIPKKHKFGVLSRRVLSLSILTGIALKFWLLYQQVSRPQYEWVGGFITIPLFSYGLVYGAMIAFIGGGVLLAMRRLGLSIHGDDQPNSIRAPGRITEHFEHVADGDKLLLLSDDRWISRTRLLAIRWIFVVSFPSAMREMTGLVELFGGLIGVTLVYGGILYLASWSEVPEAAQQPTDGETSMVVENGKHPTEIMVDDETVDISHDGIAEIIKNTDPGYVITKREFKKIASTENAEKWWNETAKPALKQSVAIEQDGKTERRWRVK